MPRLRADELPDDDESALAHLTGQPRSVASAETRQADATVHSYKGVERRCPPSDLRNAESTRRFEERVDKWEADTTAQAVESARKKIAGRLLELIERGGITSAQDIPESELASLLLVDAVDPRRPQLGVQALKELVKLRADGDQTKRAQVDAVTEGARKELEDRERRLREAHARVRGRARPEPLRKVD